MKIKSNKNERQPDKLDGMPQLRAGYVASQKIIHTIQSFFVEWEEQDGIPINNIVIARYGE